MAVPDTLMAWTATRWRALWTQKLRSYAGCSTVLETRGVRSVRDGVPGFHTWSVETGAFQTTPRSLALALCNAAHAYEGETERPGLVKGAAYLHGVTCVWIVWSVGQVKSKE